MLGLLGKKRGMTRVFNDKGDQIPVTVVEAGPCIVVQIKTTENDGYNAIQVGFVEQNKLQRSTKPLKGHFAKASVKVYKHLGEFRVEDPSVFKVGQALSVSGFKQGDLIDVTGTTKGKGFQGVIKRHGKSGGPASHGSHFHRSTGSIGMRTWPGRVLKNTGMPGHMGDETCTIQKLEIVEVDTEHNILLVKGAVPGCRNGLVVVLNREKDCLSRFMESGSPVGAGQVEGQQERVQS